MIAYVVTEGEADQALLLRLAPPDLLTDVEVVAAGESSVVSMARSLLVRRQVPVALVLDAESSDERAVQERRASTEEVVRSVSGDLPVAVILAVPELEVVLFHDLAVIERILGLPLSSELVALARAEPTRALDQLCIASGTLQDRFQIVRALTPQDALSLRGATVIQELIQFLERAHAFSDVEQGIPARA